MEQDEGSSGSMVRRMVAGRDVGAVGLGCAGLSLFPPPHEQGIATIHAALDAGVQVLDTAPAYVPDAASQGHNERLVAEALAGWDGDRSAAVVVCKGGHARVGDGHDIATDFEVCGRPDYIRAQADATLRALGVDAVDLYLLHQPDSRVPIVESMGALEALRRAGKARHVGVCNVTIEQLDACETVGTVDAVQNGFSPLSRDRSVLDWCEARWVPFLAYSPLGGLFGPAMHELGALRGVAARHGASSQQVALAWAIQQSPVLIPIPGCRRPEHAADCAAAMRLELDESDRERLMNITADAQPFDAETDTQRRHRLETRLDDLINEVAP